MYRKSDTVSTQETRPCLRCSELLPDLWTALIHGFYAASNGNTLPTLRDDIRVSFPSSRVKKAHSIIAQKSGVLIIFAAEAWNHYVTRFVPWRVVLPLATRCVKWILEHAQRFCCEGMTTTMKGEIINVGRCLSVDTM